IEEIILTFVKMAINGGIVLVLSIASFLISFVSAAPGILLHSIQVTLHRACYGNTPQGTTITSASDTLWNNGAVWCLFKLKPLILLSLSLPSPLAASACYGNTPEGTMIGSASDVLWNNGAVCGKWYRVTCTGPTNPVPHPCYDGKSVTVKVVDHCPGCQNTFDLSKEAFSTIANPVAGVIKIDYTAV
ncbi:RlpA-like protein, double-psi beta-barrel domain, partial [Dillenia turbinata]